MRKITSLALMLLLSIFLPLSVNAHDDCFSRCDKIIQDALLVGANVGRTCTAELIAPEIAKIKKDVSISNQKAFDKAFDACVKKKIQEIESEVQDK